MPYSSRHVSALFAVSGETVRAWSEEFSRHLSPTANPGKGRHRQFSEEDMTVFTLIAELKAQGMTFDDIHIALDNGQRGQAPVLPPEEVQMIVASEHEKRLSLEVEYLQRSLSKIQQELEDTRAELNAVRQFEHENIRLRASLEHTQSYSDKRIEELTKQLEESQKRVNELTEKQAKLEREIGETYARGVMDALERRGDLPKKD